MSPGGVGSLRLIILPQDPDHPATAVPIESLKVKFPKTFAFFKGFEKEIWACALLAQFFDPKSDPFYSSYNVGGYTYAPFKVVWKEICLEIEAVVIEDPDRSVVPDHKLVMVAFDKAEPAYFLLGLLNSIPIGLFVRSYAVQTSISGHIFDMSRSRSLIPRMQYIATSQNSLVIAIQQTMRP